MPDDYFGKDVAARYDESMPEVFEEQLLRQTVDVLAELAGDGAALELGIGTGRVAIPLCQRGVPVHGIDLSSAMVEKLRAKPGAEGIDATIGDFATTRVDGRFSLVLLVFNTIMNLTSQDEQVACFHNAATHLEPGGHFLIEVMVPELQRLPTGERYRPYTVTPTQISIDEYDVVTQRLVSNHYRVVDGRLSLNAIPFRYVWPAELDLMARIAGLTLRHRWSGWDRSPFTSESGSHVSVWQKPS